jgi:hypothetical protein
MGIFFPISDRGISVYLNADSMILTEEIDREHILDRISLCRMGQSSLKYKTLLAKQRFFAVILHLGQHVLRTTS